MRQIKLTGQEKKVEDLLVSGEYIDVDESEFDKIKSALAARKNDKAVTIYINSRDLRNLKQKAKKLGIRYQAFVSELIHRVAL